MGKMMTAVHRTAAWFERASWPQAITAGVLAGLAVGLLAARLHTAF